jgi:site-specific recombinase XerD
LNQRPRAYEASDQLQLLNKITLSDFLEFSKFSKSYVSQVKSGHRPPSKRFLKALEEYAIKVKTKRDYLNLFLQSRQAIEVTYQTLEYYRGKLGRFLRSVNADKATRQDIEIFLLQFKNPGNRHAYYRVIKTFYNWREEIFDKPSPIKKLKAPRLGKPILPTLTADQVLHLINIIESPRDKAIIAMFTESGLRLSELVNIKVDDIDWLNGTIKVLGKGRKEALAPLGKTTQQYLKIWLQQYQVKDNE